MAARLMKERKKLMDDEEEMNLLGIYVNWHDDDIRKVTAMIVGPEDTPYAYGYFFFDIQFPDQYPHVCPKVQFRTGDRRVRFHPNLYTEGKVCLSILGTWQGPGWTSVMTLRTVLITIQSLMHNSPIVNEPGYERYEGREEDKRYSRIISYETINVAILRMLDKQPAGFESYLPTMQKLFVKNYANIKNNMAKGQYAEKWNDKEEMAPLWAFKTKYAPTRVLNDCEKHFKDCSAMHPRIQPDAIPGGSGSGDAAARSVAASSSSSASPKTTVTGVKGVKKSDEKKNNHGLKKSKSPAKK